MRDRRKPRLLNVTMLILTAALAVSCFFLPVPEEDLTGSIVSVAWLSDVLSLLSLTAVAISAGLLNYRSFLFTSDTQRLFLPYLIVVLSVPGVLSFGLYHIAALLEVWAMFFAIGYVNSELRRPDYAFLSLIAAGAASMMVPPLVYVELFVFLYCLYKRNQSPLKYLLAALAGAALPWLYLLAWSFIFPESLSIKDFLAVFGQGAALSLPDVKGLNGIGAAWCAVGVLLVLRTSAFVLARRRERNKAQKNAFGLSVALSIISLLAAVFCGMLSEPLFIMAAAVPVSFTAFDLFTNGTRVESGLWITLLLVLAAAQRVLDFFPGVLP